MMIDLHTHILPGIDDGAESLDVAVAMARAWVADGVTIVACTPHITPGIYANEGPGIRLAVAALQAALDADSIPLRLVTGADNHIVPDMAGGLASGHLLPLADTRYVLVEPPHHVAPVRLDELFFSLMLAGYVPILTHPERLHWIKQHYATIERLADAGVWMQVTSGSLLGAFGSAPKYWAERMLDEGRVHILATDAHNMRRRPPNLSRGRDAAAKKVGTEEAERLVVGRPQAILANELPSAIILPAATGRGTRQSNGASHDGRGEGERAGAGLGIGGASRGSIVDRMRRFLGQ